MNQARFSACTCQLSLDRHEVEATRIALIDAMTRSSTSGSATHSPPQAVRRHGW